MSPRGLSLALLLLAVAVVAAAYSLSQVNRQLDIAASCEAAGRGEWSEALRLTEGFDSKDADGRIAAECRCWALLAEDRGDECTALLEEGLAAAPEWVPDATLARRIVRARRDRGETRSAADFAAQAGAVHQTNLNLLHLDLSLRSALHGEARVLAEAEAGLDDDPESTPWRIVLAANHRRGGDAEAALRVLGDRPPSPGSELLGSWFEERSGALADLGRGAELRAAFVRWEELGASPPELRARFALLVSTSQLRAPVGSVVAMLQASLSERDALQDLDLTRSLFERLIAHLMSEDREGEALAVYDTAVAEVELPSLTRDQLERSIRKTDPATAKVHGRLVFELDGALDDFQLLVSAPPSAALDSEFEAYVLSEGGATIERDTSDWPVRWGLRDGTGALRASGSVWPASGETTVVPIALRSPVAPRAEVAAPRRDGDGRTRVFSIVLDSADWRLTQYLRMRGELPFLDHMLRHGHRAVLDSSPPLTAAAMESLVWPGRRKHVSFVGLLHQLGLEVGGLASVGKNPVEFLAGVLPESPSFFEVIGRGPRVAANMLFAHGAIDAGRHAELVGPAGKRSLARRAERFRTFDLAEREDFPELATDPRVRSRVETIASEFDVADAMASEGEVDLLMLRVESLDVLTHALYVELERSGQDDGKATLLSVYRYIDSRLAVLDAALDADDVLVVMSDHGVRNPMEHDRNALFVAIGGGVPVGRSVGTPELRGVPRVLADMLSVETDWADTGIAPWLSRRDGQVVVLGGAGE